MEFAAEFGFIEKRARLQFEIEDLRLETLIDEGGASAARPA